MADQNNGVVRVTATDNGIGIPASERENVMRPLARLNPEAEGSGFGLAICRRVLRSFDGNIWIEAGDEFGTTVSFELKVAN